jgi:hypothetical protein
MLRPTIPNQPVCPRGRTKILVTTDLPLLMEAAVWKRSHPGSEQIVAAVDTSEARRRVCSEGCIGYNAEQVFEHTWR